MRTRLLLFCALLIVTDAPAQSTGEIHGRVTDRSGTPLYLAHVSVERGDALLGTATDEEGRFVLKPLVPGLYTVRISYVGMTPREEIGVHVGADRITRLGTLELTANTDLPELVIEARVWEPPLIDVAEPTKLSFIASQLQDNPQRKEPITMIANLSPDIYRAPHSDELHFRGSRSDAMVWFVDGVKVMGRLSGVPPAAIASVTLYTGGLPARYGDVTGGVVAIETKSYLDLYLQAKAGLR